MIPINFVQVKLVSGAAASVLGLAIAVLKTKDAIEYEVQKREHKKKHAQWNQRKQKNPIGFV